MNAAPLLVVGLDGADWRLLDRLMAAGHMPCLQRLTREGVTAPLRSTLPAATLPAWSSFLTGCAPARHGVADLLLRAPNSYDLLAATGEWRSLPTFLARLSAQGRTVVSLGMPGTYPPEPVAGVCVAGFDAPGARAAGRWAVWPPPFYARLQALGGWQYATFNEHGGASHAQAVDALLADIAVKERVALAVAADQAWDVLCVHLQASDTAAHHLWHTFDPQSPRARDDLHSDALPRIYARLDAVVGRLLAALPPGGRALVVSDHGMGGAGDAAVHLNRWLHAQGLLTFATPAVAGLTRLTGQAMRGALRRLPKGSMGLAMRHVPQRLHGWLLRAARGMAVAYNKSQAFSDELDYAPAIWLNRRGVFPSGRVTAAEAGKLALQLHAALADLRHPVSGLPLVERVYRRAELPDGPHRDRLPDLLIEPAWPQGYRPSFLPSPGPGPAVRTLAAHELHGGRGAGMPGAHRREGIFVAWGPDLAAQRIPALDIDQAGACIYPLVGLPVPGEVDAEIPASLAPLLQGVGHMPLRPEDGDEAPRDPYTPAQNAALMERLDGLGYL